MNQSPLTKVLLIILAVTAIAAPILCIWYISKAREVRKLQTEMNLVTARQQFFGLLVTDALEYSKKNKAIDPILQTLLSKTNTAPASATTPPTR